LRHAQVECLRAGLSETAAVVGSLRSALEGQGALLHDTLGAADLLSREREAEREATAAALKEKAAAQEAEAAAEKGKAAAEKKAREEGVAKQQAQAKAARLGTELADAKAALAAAQAAVRRAAPPRTSRSWPPLPPPKVRWLRLPLHCSPAAAQGALQKLLAAATASEAAAAAAPLLPPNAAPPQPDVGTEADVAPVQAATPAATYLAAALNPPGTGAAAKLTAATATSSSRSSNPHHPAGVVAPRMQTPPAPSPLPVRAALCVVQGHVLCMLPRSRKALEG
jgi:hypothetical protein